MAEKRASKTNIAARQEQKAQAQLCSKCGKKIDIVMTLTLTGRKMMVRRCCGATI